MCRQKVTVISRTPFAATSSLAICASREIEDRHVHLCLQRNAIERRGSQSDEIWRQRAGVR